VAMLGLLYQLQTVDSEWDARQRRLVEIAELLADSQDLLEARAAVEAGRKKLEAYRLQLRQLELEVGGLTGKMKANQEKLYGGAVRNPKELQGLQEEAAALGRRRAEIEDQQLDVMILSDSMDAEVSERTARLRQIESSRLAQHQALEAERTQIDLQLAELQSERESLRSRLSRGDLLLYDDLRSQLGGTVVARLRHGVCEACGVDVPSGVSRAVERGEGQHFCPICDRLLCGTC